MKITPDIEKAVQESMIRTLKSAGVDTDHPYFAMVVILIEPKSETKYSLHLGSYHCDDSDVLEYLARAPESVAHTLQLEAQAERAAGKMPS
jgi:hypothetical protein